MNTTLLFADLVSAWCLGMWVYLIWCITRKTFSTLKWLLPQVVGVTVVATAIFCFYLGTSWIISYGCFVIGGLFMSYGTMIRLGIIKK